MSLIMDGGYYEWRIVNGSNTYEKENIVSGALAEGLYTEISIGNAVSKQLKMKLYAVDIDPSRPIDLSYKESTASTRNAKGTYYIDSVATSPYSEYTEFVAFDAMLKAEAVYMKTGEWSTTTDAVLLSQIASVIGVSVDSYTSAYFAANPITIDQAPSIGPNGTTCRQILSVIGALRGGNFIIDDTNKLKFVPLFGYFTSSRAISYPTTAAYTVGDEVVSFDKSDAEPIVGIEFQANGGQSFRYPSNLTDEEWEALDGRILYCNLPFMASQEAVNRVGSRYIDSNGAAHGISYIPYTAGSAYIAPNATLGLLAHIKDTDVHISNRVIDISPLASSGLSAETSRKAESHYPSVSPGVREARQKAEQNYAAIQVLENQISLKVDTTTFEAAEASNYASITPMYLANDGTRTPATNDPNWSTTPPTLQEGQHMWTMTVYVKKSGATSYSQPMDITGTEGVAGRGIDRVENYYQVSNNGDTAPTTWPAAGVIPQMTPTNRFLWGYEITYYTDNTSESTTPHVIGVYGQTGEPGQPGTNGNDAYNYELIVSHPVIVKSEAGAYNPTSITLTAKRGQGTGNPANYSGRFKIESTTNNSTWTTVYTSSSNEATRTQTVPSNIIALRCSLYLAGGTSTLLDQQTVPIVSDGATGQPGQPGQTGEPGADAYTVLLSNENHSFAAGTNAATATNITVNVLAYKGASRIAATIGTITGQVTGLTTSLVSNGTTSAGFKVTVTSSLTTKSGQLTVPITVDGQSFTKIFTWSLALTGQPGAEGDDGVGIDSITEYYGRSRAANVEPTASGDAGSWSTTYQSVDATWKFLWNYEVVTYTDNTSFTSQKRIIGTYAQDGINGRNPVAFDQYLCANEDPDNPPAASANWIHVSQFNLADYQDDENHHYYIWTKTKTTWDVGEPTWTEPYLDTYYVNVTAQFNVLAGSINSSVKEVYDAIGDESKAREELEGVVNGYGERISTVESLSTTVTQTAHGLEAITTRVAAVEGELQEQSNYMRWHGDAEVPYLEIGTGQSDSNVHTEMRGDAFAVVSGGTDSMVADESGVTARAFKASESVDIGRFRWVDEGSLGFSLI